MLIGEKFSSCDRDSLKEIFHIHLIFVLHVKHRDHTHESERGILEKMLSKNQHGKKK